jgi:Secretion system C-terminal sorting domain/Carbohydrate binding domain
MKKIVTISLIYTFFLATIAKGQDTLNFNGGFESMDTMTLVPPVDTMGWLFDAGSGKGFCKIMDTVTHSGSKAAYVNVSVISTNYWDIQLGNENIKAPHGQFYRASFWAESPTKSSIFAMIGDYNYNTLSSIQVTLTPKWTKYIIMCGNDGLATNQDSLRVVFQKFIVGKYYFDDILFIQSNVASLQVFNTGDSVLVNTGFAMSAVPAVFNNNSFSVTVNGVADPVTSVTLSKSSNRIIVLKLTNLIKPGDKVFASHVGGKLSYSSSTGLPSTTLGAFADSVENYSNGTIPSYIKAIEKPNQFLVYPNPAKDIINLLGIDLPKDVYFINNAGQIIQSKIKSGVVSVSSLPQGFYIVKIVDNSGKSRYSSFIKK